MGLGRLRLAALAFVGTSLVVGAVGCRQRPPEPRAAPQSRVHFTEVAPVLGLDYRYSAGGDPPLNLMQVSAGGAAFIDYDADGWLDVLCVGYPEPALYHNEHGQRFVNVTKRSGMALHPAHWYGCAVGDYDNDGFPDLLLTAYREIALLHNQRNGTFRDVTRDAGLALRRWATSAAFADVDRDGRLDLYVGCYVDFGPSMQAFEMRQGVPITLGPLAYEAVKGVLYHNEDGTHFRDVTAASGLDRAHGKALGVAFGDVDNDGDDDLFVANDEVPQDFFINDGRGRFRPAANDLGLAYSSEGRPQGGMGVDFGDTQNSGYLDIFLANFANEPKSLYRNHEGKFFENIGIPAGISQTTRPWVAFGAKLVDLDNDGLLDLVIANGHVQDQVARVDPRITYPQRPQLFLNVGGGRFREAGDEAGRDFARAIVGRALAVGDFNNDGAEDLLIADLSGAPLLLRNDSAGPQHNWLGLRLTGSRSNRMGIGARVELTAAGRTQVREVRTDGSYLSAHDPRVHFGLGAASQADEIRIRWPSGTRQTVRDLSAHQVMPVKEPASP